jgi:hypothetical protein
MATTAVTPPDPGEDDFEAPSDEGAPMPTRWESWRGLGSVAKGARRT